jgi:hypothetical protein
MITEVTGPKAWTVFFHSTVGVVASNPTWGMDVCMRLFCLCYPVEAEALWQNDPVSKESIDCVYD